MYLDDALRKIGESGSLNSFPWELREAEWIDRYDDLKFDSIAVERYARFCGLDDDSVSQMLCAAKIAEFDEALAIVGKAVFRAVFLMDRMAMGNSWPSLERCLGIRAHTFFLVLATGFVPLVRRWHAQAGFSEEVTRHTCEILAAASGSYRNTVGVPGIARPAQFAWMRNYIQPEKNYQQIKRFGFMTEPFALPVVVYRHKKSRELSVLALSGIPVDAAGYAVTPDGGEAEFITTFEIVDGCAVGHRITREGRTEKGVVSIPLIEYELTLGQGMPVLGMHIPAGGGMSPDIAEESFRAAKTFYSLIPDRAKHPCAIVCSSWIFNPNFPEILPSDSNLNLLLKRVHPVPIPSGKEDGLWFIFRHTGEFKVSAMPRKTSLQRSVLEYIERGGRWRAGGMFLLMDEIQ